MFPTSAECGDSAVTAPVVTALIVVTVTASIVTASTLCFVWAVWLGDCRWNHDLHRAPETPQSDPRRDGPVANPTVMWCRSAGGTAAWSYES
jgi:hypothetical protein